MRHLFRSGTGRFARSSLLSIDLLILEMRGHHWHLLLWLCQAAFLARHVSSFSFILMGVQRGKGKLARSLDNSIQDSSKTTNNNKAQELTGITLPEEGNYCFTTTNLLHRFIPLLG